MTHAKCRISPQHPRKQAGNGRISKGRTGRIYSIAVVAMVNVDFSSPSLVLGAALIGCGVTLLQMRSMQTQISRDADIVVAAMVSIVGSTLIFQGWRLDPLLLLCQALTTSVAFWYGLEAFRLRAKTDEGLMLPPSEQAEPFFTDPQEGRQGPGMTQQPYAIKSTRQYPYSNELPGSRWLPSPNSSPGTYFDSVGNGDVSDGTRSFDEQFYNDSRNSDLPSSSHPSSNVSVEPLPFYFDTFYDEKPELLFRGSPPQFNPGNDTSRLERNDSSEGSSIGTAAFQLVDDDWI